MTRRAERVNLKLQSGRRASRTPNRDEFLKGLSLALENRNMQGTPRVIDMTDQNKKQIVEDWIKLARLRAGQKFHNVLTAGGMLMRKESVRGE